MACNHCTKKKYTCGDIKTNAHCVYVDKDVLSEGSDLREEDCVVVHETLSELYEWVEELKEAYKDIDTSCLTVETNEEGEVTQRELNEAIIQKLCTTENTESDGGGHEDFCDLDFKEKDKTICTDDIKTNCEFFQYIIDRLDRIEKNITNNNPGYVGGTK